MIDQMLAAMKKNATVEKTTENSPSSSTSSRHPPAKRPRQIKPEAMDNEEEFAPKNAETHQKNNCQDLVNIATKEEFEQLKRKIAEQLNLLATKEELERQKRQLLDQWSLDSAVLATKQVENDWLASFSFFY